MKVLKSLNTKKALKILNSVYLFISSFPLKGNELIKESSIIDNIYKFYNVINHVNTKDSTISATAVYYTDDKEENIDIIDRSEIFIGKLFNEFKSCSSIKTTSHLINISNSFLNSKGIKLFHKINVIDAENSLLKDIIERFLEEGDENTVRDFLIVRIKIILNTIYTFEDKIKGDPHFNQDKNILYPLLNLYIGYNINFHIYRNQIFQIFNLLKEEFELNEDKKIKKIFLEQLISLNSRFLLEPKSNLLEILEDSTLFFDEELAFQKMLIESKLPNLSIHGLKFSKGKITREIVEKYRIFTIIRFSLPFKTRGEKNGIVRLNDKITLEFKSISNKFTDPLYRIYKDLIIGGLSWNFFSDTFYSDKEELSTIAFIIEDFYHPDFKFNEKGIVDIDFSDKKALTGRDYYPHKEFIIKTFLENSESLLNLFEIEKKDITINLFSNYIVDYLNLNANIIVNRKLYSITNPDSFSKASDKFIERLNKLNLSDYFIPIQELVNNTSLVTDRSLSLLIQKLIEIILKGNIELHSNYKYFWRSDGKGKNIPQKEPYMQPLIANQLRTICDYMGIQLSREIESANGAIDFHCSFTHNGKLLKVCIELKNAHSPNYELGLTKQLPEYLKSERTRSGIYVILWYKGNEFSKPEKFDKPEDLRKYLQGKRPKGYKTDVLVIDCSKPIVPSKRK